MKYLLKSFIAITLIFTFACEEGLVELSNNPNIPGYVNEGDVLSNAQAYLGVVQDLDLNQGSFLWAQYYTWGIGVSIGNQERFVSQPDDRNGYWGRAYATCLADLKFLTASENAGYSAIAKILTVYTYQGLVDHFGDVPYSEALQGDAGIEAPNYDPSATIYSSLVTTLDEALTQLSTVGSGVGGEDLIFGGDFEKWTRFANSLKLRILMRTSETNPQGTAIQSLISSGIFLESADDLAQIDWSGATGGENPMYAAQLNGVGDFYFASNATLDVLTDLGDPRAPYFYSLTSGEIRSGTIFGIDQGTIDDEPFTADAADYSGSSTIANGAGVPTVFMSPWEVWFLRAEADARYGTADDAETAFGTAIQSNFDFLGAGDASAYITSLNYAGAATQDEEIDLIAVQKWISMNGTQEDEGWIETRRFDRPASRLFTNGIFQTPPLSVLDAGEFPAAWLYPASEVSFNGNVAPQRTITDQLFWDN